MTFQVMRLLLILRAPPRFRPPGHTMHAVPSPPTCVPGSGRAPADGQKRPGGRAAESAGPAAHPGLQQSPAGLRHGTAAAESQRPAGHLTGKSLLGLGGGGAFALISQNKNAMLVCVETLEPPNGTLLGNGKQVAALLLLGAPIP